MPGAGESFPSYEEMIEYMPLCMQAAHSSFLDDT